MRLFRALVFCALVAASICRGEVRASADDPQWVVFTDGSAFKRPCSRGFPSDLSGGWNPEASDIARAEYRFDAAVEAAFAQLPAEHRERRPTNYYRQYAGFLRSGTRVLYLNAVAEEVIRKWDRPDHPWRQNAVLICDGGTLTFGAVFDFEKDAFDSVEFNGTYAGPLSTGHAR